MTTCEDEIKEEISETKEKLERLQRDLEKCKEDPIIKALKSFDICLGVRKEVFKSQGSYYLIVKASSMMSEIFMAESLKNVMRENDLTLRSISVIDGTLKIGFNHF